MEEFIKLGNLPQSLLDAIGKERTAFTVAFLRIKDSPQCVDAQLLGSGTLVTAGQTQAILTAHHVVRELPRNGRLGILLEKASQPHSMDTSGLAFLEIARGEKDCTGPDLGAVILAPSIASAIGAKKLFYNLDSHRNLALKNPPGIHDGVWFVQGFLDERTVVTPDTDRQGKTTAFYNFTGFGGLEPAVQIGDFDYFDFLDSKQARQVAPLSWGGVSGGGLWQVHLKREGGELVHKSALLCGVAFYQQPASDGSCVVRCHGPRSVYEAAFNAILNREP